MSTAKHTPDNPPRLRRDGESVEDYRAAMGWAAMSKPTPGPWNVADQIRAAVWIRTHKVMLRDSSPESHANARLIAAAPDLLEALQDLFGADMERVLMGDGKEDQIAAIAKARAAIAKAIGGAA
jgi:hypothetical protein